MISFRVSLLSDYGYTGEVSFNMSCPPGSFVVGVFGCAGDILDAVGLYCSDGSNVGLSPIGASGGKPLSSKICSAGFSSLWVEYDNGWGSIGGIGGRCNIDLYCIDGGNSGSKEDFICPSGQLLQAVEGTSGPKNVVRSVHFICS